MDKEKEGYIPRLKGYRDVLHNPSFYGSIKHMLSVSEVAEYLSVSPRRVRQLIESDHLRARRLSGV